MPLRFNLQFSCLCLLFACFLFVFCLLFICFCLLFFSLLLQFALTFSPDCLKDFFTALKIFRCRGSVKGGYYAGLRTFKNSYRKRKIRRFLFFVRLLARGKKGRDRQRKHRRDLPLLYSRRTMHFPFENFNEQSLHLQLPVLPQPRRG